MSCGCEKLKAEDKFQKSYSPCRFCAMKHLTTAWRLFNEYAYTTLNMCAIEGECRLAINHLMMIDQDTCFLIREIALLVQQRKLEDLEEKFHVVLEKLQAKILAENPDIEERDKKLRNK